MNNPVNSSPMNRRLKLQMCGLSSVDAHYENPTLHTHDLWQMNVVVKGMCEISQKSLKKTFYEGDIIIFPPDCPHGIYYDYTEETRVYSFKFTIPGISGVKPLSVICRRDSRTMSLITALNAIFEAFIPAEKRKPDIQYVVSSESDNLYILEDLLFGIVYYYCLLRVEKPIDGELVYRMADYINHKGGAPVSVSDLAQAMGYSEGHLLLLTRERAGMSTKQFINKERIQIARSYLKYSNMNISEISEKMGFNDALYFGKFFRRYTGETPGYYKRRSRLGLK